METLLIEAYRHLTNGTRENASEAFARALAKDFDNEELLFAMRCDRWWEESLQQLPRFPDGFEAAEYLVQQWKDFKAYAASTVPSFERAVLAFRHYVFGLALAQYETLLSNGESNDPEISLRIGRMHKGRGDYEKAIHYLDSAAKSRRDDAAVLAELADTWELLNEARSAKALFREAFFLNPQRIDLDLLESGSIRNLSERIEAAGRTGHEVVEWIAVYGEVLGVFSVKRELKPIEAGKLKQSIYELETELAGDGSRRAVLVPRLINRYFWLADHYVNAKEDKQKVDELLLKIKLLDPAVYKLYVA